MVIRTLKTRICAEGLTRIMTNKLKDVLAVCLFLLISLMFFLISRSTSINKPDENFLVFGRFISAMKKNNGELAKSVVSPENFPRIDKWMSEHEVFVYSPIWIFTNSDPFEYVIGGGSGSCVLKENVCSWGESQEYYCYDKILYRIEFDEIISKKFGSKWLIVDWSEITEVRHDPTTYCK